MKIFKLNKQYVDDLKAWAKRINTDLNEKALESLREENCSREIFQLVIINDEYYLMTHMEGNNITPSESANPINIEHRKVLSKVIIEKIDSEVLYDLKV